MQGEKQESPAKNPCSKARTINNPHDTRTESNPGQTVGGKHSHQCAILTPCQMQILYRTHPWTSLRFIRRVFSLLSFLFQAHVKIQVHDHGCFFRDISNLQGTRYLCLVMEDSRTLYTVKLIKINVCGEYRMMPVYCSYKYFNIW